MYEDVPHREKASIEYANPTIVRKKPFGRNHLKV
jgi:hypothetical protein